ncbi:acetamidase/formamidase [Microlunatus elymi]|uniref:Acetamidase/formamidase n=1 Tax=Microlunatus elymi TaxID=2596828 RepID=A0A516Q2X9_9ACTN|nr:acetamidase/formamidase family protein [Microlunatus elymi]QDP97776.1 acetamidase/formamidase [Microlunatus elymi]
MTQLLTKDRSRAGFSAEIEPVLSIRPGTGEVIGFETDDDAYAQMEELRDLSRITATLNPVTGPVYVEDARPGDVLAVTIHDIELSEYGWSVYIPGAGALAAPMGEEWYVRRVPVSDGVVQLTDRLSCPTAPMIGCIGVAPASGEMSTVMPSYPTGGNMDLTDARPGSTVYLPVEVPGALLSIGDLHAVMSRGESSFVAIEIAGRAMISVDVITGRRLRAPRVETPDELVCVGLGDPVQVSIDHAYEDLFAALVDEYGFTREDAYTVMSAVAHTELGGPTGSLAPDPLHPFRATGQVTLARIAKSYLGSSRLA